jgi:four helix bundle protein
MDLVVAIYGLSRSLPRQELYGLTSKMRRAAISVPSNIAEGHGRASRGEFRNFLGIAYGSLMELETHVILGQRLGYFSDEHVQAVIKSAAEVGRLINGLTSALTRQPLTPDP